MPASVVLGDLEVVERDCLHELARGTAAVCDRRAQAMLVQLERQGAFRDELLGLSEEDDEASPSLK